MKKHTITNVLIGVLKKIRKKPMVLIIIFLTITITITVLTLTFLIPKKNNQNERKEIKSNLAEKGKTQNIVEELKTEKSPSAGDLQYKSIKTYYRDGSKIPKFIYYTPEYRDDRLASLNDQIISELKLSKKVNDKTSAYSIDYFNDIDLAEIYFQKITDTNTSLADKQVLKNTYVASYMFSKKLKMNQLIKAHTSIVLKKY